MVEIPVNLQTGLIILFVILIVYWLYTEREKYMDMCARYEKLIDGRINDSSDNKSGKKDKKEIKRQRIVDPVPLDE
jgi:hypothetical protein